MPASPARFTFDLDLGTRGDRGRMMTESAILDMANAASAEGFARGFAEGETGMVAKKARDLTTAAERLAEKAAGMQAAFEDIRRATMADAAELAFAVGRKLAGHLIERQPAGELQALVEECLASLDGVPHLVVRCHPEVAEAIREAAEARMAIAGFTGRLVVIGDPDLGISDGKVEWADGGISRNVARTIGELDTTIAGFLDGRRPGRPEETGT